MENPGFETDEGDKGKTVEESYKKPGSRISMPNTGNPPPSSEPPETDSNPSKVVIEDGTVRMKRQIGLLGGVALIVGTMIGSGIFITPQRLLKRTDSVALSLVVWASCGALAILSALSYCELGTVIPRSGGEHAYFMATFSPLHKFFGQLPAFIYSWMVVLLLKPSSLSIVSLAFSQYALYPLLSTSSFCKEFEETKYYEHALKLLAVFVSMFIAVLNIASARLAIRTAIVFMMAKISANALMIGIGIYQISKGEWGALTGKWDSGNTTVGDVTASFYSGLWAYDGWNNLNFAMEELVNPYRNLPLAIIIGISLVTILYILINLSYLTVLNKAALIASSAVAIDVGDQFLGVMKWIVPVMVCLSAFGTGNGSAFTAGRISYVAGREGHMVDFLSYVHATRLTPINAIILNTVLSIPMIYASEINDLVDLFGFAAWFFYGLAMSCVIILRFTQPNIKRPFKVPIVIPVLGMLISAVLVVVPVITDPKWEYLYVLLFCFIGLMVYYPFVYKQWRLPFMDRLTKYIQLITLAAPSPYKEE